MPVGAQDSGPASPTAEEQLAQKYAPIAYLKRQDHPCDADGEPYLPAPVDVVFGDPKVILRQVPDGEELGRGVGAADLASRPEAYYLDLPGRPRTPGCGYETHFKARMADHEPVVYAHVAVEEGKGLAVQYWFWYYFNDFNDKHEGDWEMIQLLFEAESAAEALAQEPVGVAFAQHKGGETADWDDPKLEKEDGRPVSYPSRGSHASYFGPGVWLGWGKDGSGLGCDVTTGPSVRVPLEVRLVPNDIADPGHPFAWATFAGHWGERESWVYDGPKGPNRNARWSAPVSWAEGLRSDSLRLQTADVLGPTPTDVFCGLIEDGSEVFTLFKPYPWLVGGGLAALVALGVGLLALASPVLRTAWSIFASHLPTFAAIGAVVVPVTVAVNGFHYLLTTEPAVGEWLGVTEDSAIVRGVMALALYAQRAALLFLVTPAVIQATADVGAGRRPSFRRSYRVTFSRFWALVSAIVPVALFTAVLSLTVILIPLVVVQAVRWAFAAQAVIVDGASGWRALGVSAEAVKGHWWRTLAIGLVLAFVGAALGPIVGIALMVFARAPLDLANGLGAVVYAFTQPFAVVGATVLYARLRESPVSDRAAPMASGRSGTVGEAVVASSR